MHEHICLSKRTQEWYLHTANDTLLLTFSVDVCWCFYLWIKIALSIKVLARHIFIPSLDSSPLRPLVSILYRINSCLKVCGALIAYAKYAHSFRISFGLLIQMKQAMVHVLMTGWHIKYVSYFVTNFLFGTLCLRLHLWLSYVPINRQ